MGRLTIEQAIEYWKIFLDEIEELRATPGTDPEEWDEQEKATVAALEALVKQRHYKDLEEQGRLIELPCAVGDTVYMIQKRYTKCSKYQERRDEYNCQGCEELVCDSHIEHYISSLNSAPIDWIVTMENQFGKTVFLTKEEAEAKLEELKGE